MIKFVSGVVHRHIATCILFLITMNSSFAQFDIQGHRGCRGLLPENTIPAFIKAVELGVTTLELDVVITADNRVVVSHEPYLSHEICLTPEGTSILLSEEKNHNIFKMDYDQVKKYDCGSIGNKRFPNQEKFIIHKPLLSDVIEEVEKYVNQNKLNSVSYNIETKCTPVGDGIFHPSPEIFCDLVMKIVQEKNISNRTIIQSFDIRTLQYLHQQQTPVQLALLVENIKSPQYNLKKLGFQPEIYSPYFKLLKRSHISKLQQAGIKVIPWTVNTEEEMMDLIGKGVDGIITDYPDRLIQVVRTL